MQDRRVGEPSGNAGDDERNIRPPSQACVPNSAAKVIEEFMTYEALTATIHDIVFAAMNEIVAALPQWQECGERIEERDRRRRPAQCRAGDQEHAVIDHRVDDTDEGEA